MSVQIWHDVCTDCRPEMDLAICGTVIPDDHDECEIGEKPEGQDCVVCTHMLCPTCPEEEQKEIIARIG